MRFDIDIDRQVSDPPFNERKITAVNRLFVNSNPGYRSDIDPAFRSVHMHFPVAEGRSGAQVDFPFHCVEKFNRVGENAMSLEFC